MPLQGELLNNRELRRTLPVIIKPPHNNEAIITSLQARQDYCKFDAYVKERSNLLPIQLTGHRPPMVIDGLKIWSCSKLRQPNHIWSKHHKVNTGETGYN